MTFRRRYQQPIIVITTIILLVMLGACGVNEKTNTATKPPQSPAAQAKEIIYQPRYARGFSAKAIPGGVRLCNLLPWQGATDTICYDHYYNDTINKALLQSSTHAAFFSALNSWPRVKGVASFRRLHAPEVQALKSRHKLEAFGEYENTNLEKILSLKPDAVFAYSMGPGPYDLYEMLKPHHVPVYLISEHLETHPLGRAEWIVFIGILMNKSKEAIEFFRKTDSAYQGYIQNQQSYNNAKPLVLCGFPAGQNWYMPGGTSYVGKLIADAGGNYLWKRDTTRGSFPLSPEKALSQALNADVWLHPEPFKTYREIEQNFPQARHIKAFRNKHIFHREKQVNSEGANNYWEMGVTRPDLILRDLSIIFRNGTTAEALRFYAPAE